MDQWPALVAKGHEARARPTTTRAKAQPGTVRPTRSVRDVAEVAGEAAAIVPPLHSCRLISHSRVDE